MTDAPKSSTLLEKVQTRLRVASLARALYTASVAVLLIAAVTVLASRLLGLVPQSQEQPVWLLAVPATAALLAGLFYRRVERQSAARAIDAHARTKDLFLTLASLSSSAGDYQPLVTTSAEAKADQIAPNNVVPFQFARRLGHVVCVVAVLALVIGLTPQLDPFGTVEAATRTEETKKQIESIRKAALTRADELKKAAVEADEESSEIDSQINNLKSDFRKMQPRKAEANSKVLQSHGKQLNDMWKNTARNEQLRRMMNQPISRQQLSGSRSKKMNEWLKELQEGKTDGLQKQLQKAQDTMQAMAEAKSPEERNKLASQLQQELQDLQKFSRDKAGSKELSDALSKAMKSLRVAKTPGENAEQLQVSKEAMEALKKSLDVSKMEMEQMAQSAKDMKRLNDAIKTLQKAQELNAQQQLDGSKCEGCESMEDYAEMYAQMMGQGGGDGDKDRNEGDGGGVGRGGETPEDNSDPEGYKTEKEKPQIQAGKILLSIKTREYAEEKDFDPDQMREYQQGLNRIKAGVQSAIDTEEIPPGYVEGIKGYFDKIEKVDPELNDK